MAMNEGIPTTANTSLSLTERAQLNLPTSGTIQRPLINPALERFTNEDLLSAFRTEAFQNELMLNIQGSIDKTVLTVLRPTIQKVDKIEGTSNRNKDAIETLQIQIKQMNLDYNETRARLDNLDQARRIKNLIMAGIPEQPQERLDEVISQLVQYYGLPIYPYDIEKAFRLGRRDISKTGPRPVLVQFLNLKAKRDVYSFRNRMSINESTVYLSKDLTKDKSELAFLSRRSCNQFGWSTWTEDGVILIRQLQNVRAARVNSPSDLDSLIMSWTSNFGGQIFQTLLIEGH